MNLIAIDIGNTNVDVGLYIKGEEKSVETVSGTRRARLKSCLKSAWNKIPPAPASKQGKLDGVIVASSVVPEQTDFVRRVAEENLGEKMLIVGEDIAYPMNLSVKESYKVGSDRVLAAAAAYAVVEKAVVVADFGSAVTIDLVDDRGVFCGGVIFPGFEMSARALQMETACLPKIKLSKPKLPFGKTTTEAINCGIYYSAISTLQEVIRRYAEKIGTWPETVITGSAAKFIIDDCNFIDSYVPNLVTKGIALAYRKHIESQMG